MVAKSQEKFFYPIITQIVLNNLIFINLRKEVQKMKIINWLLQPTPDGATYLQAITLTAILVPIMIVLVKDMKELFRDYIKEMKR